MRRTPIIAMVVGMGLVVFIAILIAAARPASQAITIRYIKSIRTGDGAIVRFKIINHTTSSYFLYPVSVEVRNGMVWKKCYDFDPHSIKVLSLGPHAFVSHTFDLTSLPTGSPLRLRLCNNKELTGLEGVFMRLDLRFRQGNKKLSLNPFDKKTKVFSTPTEIVSEEFVEQEPKSQLLSRAELGMVVREPQRFQINSDVNTK